MRPTPYGGPGCPAPLRGAGALLALAPGPLWGAGLPRPHVGGWGGGRLISRAEPLAFLSPRRPRQRRGGRGAAAAAACTQAGRFRVMFRNSPKFQGIVAAGGSRQAPTAQADASRLRTLRSMPLYWFFLSSGACVRGAAWGSADRRPGGVTAPKMAFQAAVPVRAWPAPARCLVVGRCCSPAP